MTYTYTFTILDEDGETVAERELTAEQAIDILLSAPLEDEEEEAEETPRRGKSEAVAKEKGGRKRSSCSICGKPGHNVKTCPQNNDVPETSEMKEAGRKLQEEIDQERPPAKVEPLSKEEYEALRNRLWDTDFSSAEYALTNKLPPREVNLAIKSRDFEDYLFNR